MPLCSLLASKLEKAQVCIAQDLPGGKVCIPHPKIGIIRVDLQGFQAPRARTGDSAFVTDSFKSAAQLVSFHRIEIPAGLYVAWIKKAILWWVVSMNLFSKASSPPVITSGLLPARMASMRKNCYLQAYAVMRALEYRLWIYIKAGCIFVFVTVCPLDHLARSFCLSKFQIQILNNLARHVKNDTPFIEVRIPMNTKMPYQWAQRCLNRGTRTGNMWFSWRIDRSLAGQDDISADEYLDLNRLDQSSSDAASSIIWSL